MLLIVPSPLKLLKDKPLIKMSVAKEAELAMPTFGTALFNLNRNH
jgi:hypothetical protein